MEDPEFQKEFALHKSEGSSIVPIRGKADVYPIKDTEILLQMILKLESRVTELEEQLNRQEKYVSPFHDYEDNDEKENNI
jgi:hypothetical protein